MQYFGDPALCPELLPQTKTPVGRLCQCCGIPIEANDCGFVLPYVQSHATTDEPWHRRCFLQNVLGDDE